VQYFLDIIEPHKEEICESETWDLEEINFTSEFIIDDYFKYRYFQKNSDVVLFGYGDCYIFAKCDEKYLYDFYVYLLDVGDFEKEDLNPILFSKFIQTVNLKFN
jgi:hypothetical protein